MQGKLSEIDIRSILQLIELGQKTGELLVEAHGTSGTSSSDRLVRWPLLNRWTKTPINRSWLVFFANGQVIYACDAGGSLSRLRDHLHRYQIDIALDSAESATIAAINAPEYGCLWFLLENGILTPAQGRTIVQSMVSETLFDLLSLHQGVFVFELSSALSPQLTTLEIAPLVTTIMQQVQAWKQFHPHIQCPDQCPVIADEAKLRGTLTEKAFNTLVQWVDGKTSLRQMSRYLNRDMATIARAIYPYLKQGWVSFVDPISSESRTLHQLDVLSQITVPRIVCIDDGASIRKAIESILQQQGYEATAISNPLRALSLVFQLQPDLILCDIAMPELDGYELCAMLRQSTAFRETPIIMLTGKDGFIDRVKARMVGATDYLTKPFSGNELLMLVEKYVGSGYPDRPSPEKLLAEALRDEIEK